MRRALLLPALILVGVASLAGGVWWALRAPVPPAGTPRAERLWLEFCSECHGADGRGSWRATVFVIRPGDLTSSTTAAESDQYLFDIIKSGGSPIGRPGMPAYGAQLSDEEIWEVLRYLRSLRGRAAS